MHLDTKRDVKVLGDVRLGPELDPVVLYESDALESPPAEKGVVTNERRDISTADSELNLCVDQIREPGNAVFEELVSNLHNTGCVLE